MMLMLSALSVGCTFDPPGSVLDKSAQADARPANVADANEGVGSVAGKAFFQANIAPLLTAVRPNGTCNLCHLGAEVGNGPDFLGATALDTYEALVSVPRLIALTPETSVFYNKGAHAGDAFEIAELDLISQWIVIENSQ